MISPLRFAFTVLLLIVLCVSSKAQTVLYDFQDFEDPFGHFGAITTEATLLQDCGEFDNVCASHTGDFTASVFNPNDFGMLEIGPFTGPTSIDLSGFIGYSIDARFIRDTDGMGGAGNELFTGLSPIKFGVQWDPSDPCNGSMNQCSDLYDEPVELTEDFETYTVFFDDFLEGNPRDSVQLKMIMLTGDIDPDTGIKVPGSDWSDGIGRLEFDNIIGILPTPGDYNGNGAVGAADYTVWRDTLGSTTDLRANGDDTGPSMGIIDQADYDVWAANYGASASLSAAIPEPTSLVLLLVMSGSVLVSRMR